MKKLLKVIVGIVVILFLVVTGLVLFLLGPTVEKAVETIGPKAIGAELTLEKLRIDPLRGTVQLKGLFIGNPPGFASDSAVKLKQFRIDVALGSLLTDTIVVKQILIDAPEFTYERTLKTDNIQAIQKNIAAYTAREETLEEEPAAEEAAAKKPAGKKVIIEHLLVKDGRVNVKIYGFPTAPIPLPDVEKTDIGKQEGGTTWAAAGQEIVAVIYDAISGAVASMGTVSGDALKDAGGITTEAGKILGGTAGDALKGIGGLFKKKE